ncbi:MAG: type I-G CRISPR-associated protein Csb2, partial [Acidimicrobiia bacterium]
EGAPEWPPSPWRLLRALYATWKIRCPDLPASAVEGALAALVDPPSFGLPPHREAHTRHYMPDIGYGTDKIFDPFVVLPPGEMVLMHWATATLGPAEREALDALVGQLAYLGRAESICDARLLTETPPGKRLEPLADGDLSPTQRTVGVLVPSAPLDMGALVTTTLVTRRVGLTEPPGTRRVRYRAVVPVDASSPTRRTSRRRAPTGVRLAVSSSALPAYTSTLVMCEWLRKAVQARFGRRSGGGSSPTLSGKTSCDLPRTDQHAHAHYLALPGEDGRLLETFIVWAPEGLSDDEVRALAAVDLLRLRSDDLGRADSPVPELRPVRLALEAVGSIEAVAPELVSGSGERRWHSRTPFVPGRHLNEATARRLARAEPNEDPWHGFVAMQVREELAARGLPVPDSVRVWPTGPGEGDHVDWLAFRRHRAWKRERLADAPRGVGVEINFPDPLLGPIALGRHSHFGLGLFRAVSASTP